MFIAFIAAAERYLPKKTLQGEFIATAAHNGLALCWDTADKAALLQSKTPAIALKLNSLKIHII